MMKLLFLVFTLFNFLIKTQSQNFDGNRYVITVNCSMSNDSDVVINKKFQVIQLRLLDSCNESQVSEILKYYIQYKDFVTGFDLSNNSLTHFPHFKDFEHNFSLDLSNNQIQKIEKFEYLNHIISLNLSNNEIEKIGNVFKLTMTYFKINSYSLETLDLSNNKITQLKKLDFESLNSLKNLNLKNNQILFIHSDTFMNLIKLEYINLAFNNIHEIPNNLFHQNLSFLKNIELSNNFLTEIELWPLFLSNINLVNLDNNEIEVFTNKLSIDVSKLKLPSLSSTARIFLRKNKIFHFDDRAVQQYGICSSNEFDDFYEKYFKPFDLSDNPIKCVCKNKTSIVNETYLKRILNSYNHQDCEKRADMPDPCFLSQELNYCKKIDKQKKSKIHFNLLSIQNSGSNHFIIIF
jgi:Leucine-rich repeat (LRR) protein